MRLRDDKSPHLEEIKVSFSKWYQSKWLENNKLRKGIDEGNVNNAIDELIREGLKKRRKKKTKRSKRGVFQSRRRGIFWRRDK